MNKTAARLAAVFPLVCLLISFWAVSFYGLDFGVHWDEGRSKFDSVKKSIDSGLFLQSVNEPDGFGYTYGGVNYLLTWAGLAPEVVSHLVKGPRTQAALAELINPVLYSRAVRLRVRAIYVVLASLSFVWVYCLVMLCGRSRWEARLAAAILSLSWEVGYHSRWAAPDAVMMQFASLSFLCLAVGWIRKSLGAFYLGAVSVGLTIGTKYPGGLVLPFLLVAAGALAWRESQSVRQVLQRLFALVGTSSLTFLITTPGVILDPFHFVAMLRQLKALYSSAFYGYAVEPGVQHLGQILSYFALQGFSPYRPLSAVFAAFCLLGLAALVAERKPVELLFACFCVAYVAYFAQQGTMFVRNLLVVFPFLALASARGVIAASQWLRSWRKFPVYALVGGVLIVNFGWEVYAAGEITKRNDSEYFLKKFDAYVRQASRDTFFVSAQLRADLERLSLGRSGNIVTDTNAAFTKVAFLQGESAARFWTRWPSNRWGLYDRTFGSLEVNLGAYSTFDGNERILVVDRTRLAILPLAFKDLATDPGVPRLTIDKTEVIGGKDSYTVTVTNRPNANVMFRYMVDGSEVREFGAVLDEQGRVRFDVSADTQKGLYRILAFRVNYGWDWLDADATLLVK